MTKTYLTVILFCLIITGCDNSKTRDSNINNSRAANDKADIDKLNGVLKKYDEPSQTFNVSADTPSLIRGRQGTKISINPRDLETQTGKPLGQTIEVELKELTSQVQLLSANAQTVSDGKLLVSGGAYFIGMTSNGERLKLKEEKSLSVQFPKISDKEMSLFYGQRNDQGQMNWQKAPEIFKSSKQSRVVTESPTKKSDIDAILDYVDSGSVQTPQQKIENAKKHRDYVVSQKVYDAIGINKLGWINCDRFLEVEDTTALYATFNKEDSVRDANVYLIFKDINSVIQAYYYSDKSPQFENMPVGYKARLIAYTVKNEKVFAYSTDLTIINGQKLAMPLKEVSDKDFKKLIGN